MPKHYVRYIIIPFLLAAVVIALLVGRHKEKSDVTAVADNEKPQVFVPLGNGAFIASLAWSPDGKYALSGGQDGTVCMWEVASGREIRTFRAQNAGRMTALAYLPGGKQFITGSGDSTVRVWDVRTLKEVKRFHAKGGVLAISFAQNGQRLLATTDGPFAHVWSIASGKETGLIEGVCPKHPAFGDSLWNNGGSLGAALSSDGLRVLTKGRKDSTLALWDASNGKLIREWPLSYGDALCVAFANHDSTVLCGTGASAPFETLRGNGFWSPDGRPWSPNRTAGGGLEVWKSADGEKALSIVANLIGVSAICVLPDGHTVLTGGLDSTLRLWNLKTGGLVRELPKSGWPIVSMALSWDGRYALAGGVDGIISVWDIDRGVLIRQMGGSVSVPWQVAFSAEGDRIRVGLEVTLTDWDTRTGRRIASIAPDTGRYFPYFSRDGLHALVISEQSVRDSFVVRTWSRDQGFQAQIPIRVRGPLESIYSSFGDPDFSVDGQRVATMTEDSICTLWDIASGRRIRSFRTAVLPGRGQPAGIVRLSADGNHALATLDHVDLHILDFAGNQQQTLRPGSSAGDWLNLYFAKPFSDGKRCLIGDEKGTITIWDSEEGRIVHSYQLDPPVWSAVLSPDEQTFAAIIVSGGLASTTQDYSAFGLWDTQSGRKLQEYTGYRGRIGGDLALGFSTDERYLISCAEDGAARVWNRESGKEVLQLVSFKNGEWIAVTPEGYYTASLNGDVFLNVRTGSNVTGIEPYRSTFYQPEVVEAALRLGDAKMAISEVLGCKTACATIADLPDMEPPFLNVKYPENDDTLKTADTTLAFHVEDRHFPIQAVKVFVNGRPVTGNPTRGAEDESLNRSIQLDIPRDRKTLDLKVPLRLDEGQNLITITALGKSEAVDSLHVYVRTTGTLPEQMEMDTVWILAVGVNKYQDKKLHSLKYCQNDAQGIIEAFKAQEGKTCRKVMSLCISDAGPVRPTYENVVDNIGYLRQAKEHDLAILFLAGHGVNDNFGDFYFLPADAEVTGPQEFKKSKAISGAMLQTAVEVPSRRFVFVDACHSGDVGVDLVKLAREFKDNRVLIMTSSEGNKPSEEADSLKHGLFTYAIIRGLEGDADRMEVNGRVSAMELTTFVSERVAVLTKQRQNPVFWAPGGLSNFTVAMAR